MQTFFGMILGALLLGCGVYVYDSMQTSSVANGEVATTNRTIVNWDVAKADWDSLLLSLSATDRVGRPVPIEDNETLRVTLCGFFNKFNDALQIEEEPEALAKLTALDPYSSVK